TTSSAPGTARRASIARRRAWRERHPSSPASTRPSLADTVAGAGGAGLPHLVGSVPLQSAQALFTTVLRALGPRPSRVPDGETGERRRWIYGQRPMLERHAAMEVDPAAGLLELRQWDGSLLRRASLLRLKPGVDPDTVDFPTGYAEATASSWAVFERLPGRPIVP